MDPAALEPDGRTLRRMERPWLPAGVICCVYQYAARCCLHGPEKPGMCRRWACTRGDWPELMAVAELWDLGGAPWIPLARLWLAEIDAGRGPGLLLSPLPDCPRACPDGETGGSPGA